MEQVRVRLFFAVEVGEPAAGALGRAAAALRRAGADVRWTRPPYHLTLAFLGETDPGGLKAARRAGRESLGGLPGARVAFSGLGAFPSWERPRVVWGGVGAGAGELAEAAARLSARLREAGFALEERPFTAHATLGRVRSPRGAGALGALARELDRPEAWTEAGFDMKEVVLLESRLSPEGPAYAAMERYPLG